MTIDCAKPAIGAAFREQSTQAPSPPAVRSGPMDVPYMQLLMECIHSADNTTL